MAAARKASRGKSRAFAGIEPAENGAVDVALEPVAWRREVSFAAGGAYSERPEKAAALALPEL